MSAAERNKEIAMNPFKNRVKDYGLQIKGPWVFVICDANERRYFLLENRDKTTLHKLIEQEVTEGSVICSNNWEVYSKVFGNYIHQIMNVNGDCVDPIVNDHVQKMEKMWVPLRLFHKHRRGITTKLLTR